MIVHHIATLLLITTGIAPPIGSGTGPPKVSESGLVLTRASEEVTADTEQRGLVLVASIRQTVIFSDDFEDGTTDAWSYSTAADMPAGAVVFLVANSCPDGWSEFVPARGRALVGLPPAGTLGGTAGDALPDQAFPAHLHHQTMPSMTGAPEAAGHFHEWARFIDTEKRWMSWSSLYTEVIDWGDGVGSEGSGYYPLSAVHYQPDPFLGTSTAGAIHTHTVGVEYLISRDEPVNPPYIQLLACRKD